jgi:hypothetical protein
MLVRFHYVCCWLMVRRLRATGGVPSAAAAQ